MTPELRGTLESQIMGEVLKNTALRDSMRQPLEVGDLEPIYKQVKQALDLAYERGYADGCQQEALSGRS